MKKLISLLARSDIQNSLDTDTLSHVREIIQEILGGIEDGFALYDKNDNLILWNDKFLERFPAVKPLLPHIPTFSQIEEATLKSGHHKLGEEHTQRWVQMRKRQRLKSHSETEYEMANGQWIKVVDRHTSNGYVVSLCHNITENKANEGKLRADKEVAEAASRAKSTFLAHVTHELRTPLNAILGFSELMSHQLHGPIDNEQYKAYVEDIHQSAQHLLGLIEDVLTISKAQVGHMDLNEETFSLAEVVMQIERMIDQRVADAALKLEITLAPHLPLLHADERKIKQVLINLLINAIKFTPENGKITLSIQQKDGEGLHLQVEDTGVGMEKTDIPRALEAFGQVDNAISENQEGSGLGLYLTSMYIRLHGGRMDIHSKKGGGTKVTIVLPSERLVKPAA